MADNKKQSEGKTFKQGTGKMWSAVKQWASKPKVRNRAKLVGTFLLGAASSALIQAGKQYMNGG